MKLDLSIMMLMNNEAMEPVISFLFDTRWKLESLLDLKSTFNY